MCGGVAEVDVDVATCGSVGRGEGMDVEGGETLELRAEEETLLAIEVVEGKGERAVGAVGIMRDRTDAGEGLKGEMESEL
jgi:hypothetical protein